MKAVTWLLGLVALGGAPQYARAVGIPKGGEKTHLLHVTVDATFTYGIGGYSALGAQLHPVGQLSIWDAGRATGSFDFGLVVGFQDEPQALQYTSFPGLHNDAQRLNLWATIGHTFHLGKRRRAGLGVHLFNGWSHVFSQATINDPQRLLMGSFSDHYGHFNTGGMLKFDYRFSNYVGLSVQIVGPWPVGPSYVTTLFHVGVGLTGYLK